jgi:hypothetical protein
VTGGSGVIGTADVTDVVVSCASRPSSVDTTTELDAAD